MKTKFKSIIITSLYTLVFVLFFGCGYTTRGFLNPEYKTIYVKPVVNTLRVTGETQEYSSFRSVPPFLEDSFTSALISRFNIDGNLRVVQKENADLILECEITDFLRSPLRYDDDDEIEEYRIKIFFRYDLYDSNNDLVEKRNLVANQEYALTGSAAISENQALSELLNDAARRVTESIIEIW